MTNIDRATQIIEAMVAAANYAARQALDGIG